MAIISENVKSYTEASHTYQHAWNFVCKSLLTTTAKLWQFGLHPRNWM